MWPLLSQNCLIRLLIAVAASVSPFAMLGVARAEPSERDALRARAVAHYAELAQATYADSVTVAERLQRSVVALLQHPSTLTLQTARMSWVSAHRAYGHTEAFRFINGPIDDARGLEKRINTWPIDAAYLDYIQSDPKAGLINHPENYATETLTSAGLDALNQRESERNVTVGWHAIEFLLWGEDLSATGPGGRPYTDYVATPDNHAARRGKVLAAISTLLVDDLKTGKRGRR